MSNIEIARHREGTGGTNEVDARISEVWQIALQNHRSEIGRLLNLDPNWLSAHKVPFRAQSESSGFDAGAIVIVLLTAYLTGAAEGAGEETGKALIKKAQEVWQRYIRPEVTDKNEGVLGEPIDEEKNDKDKSHDEDQE